MVSDLHLGGSLRPPLDFRARREVIRLDRAVADFLDWHRAHPVPDAAGRSVPWSLVLNGDVIDFLHMGLVPTAEEAAELAAHEAAAHEAAARAGPTPEGAQADAGPGALADAEPAVGSVGATRGPRAAAEKAAAARAVVARAAAERAEVRRTEAALRRGSMRPGPGGTGRGAAGRGASGRGGGEGVDPEELLFGLDFSEERSRWKLARIAAFHRHTFPALCRFVEAGNTVTFVAGNHDADLCFEGVQDDLRRLIADHAQGDAEAVAAVMARVRFSAWFVLERGRVWFEHGHRFDPYNTFPDPLEPVPFDDNQRRLAPTFSHWGLRYFANRVRTFPLHDLEQWRFRDFVHWVRHRAGMGIARLVLVWVSFLARYLRDTSLARLRGRVRAVDRARRREALRRLAHQTALPVGRMLAIDDLHQPHVAASLGRLCLGLYLDRVALGVLALVATVACLSALDGIVTVFWMAVVGVGTVSLWRLFDRHRPAVDAHPVHGRMCDRVGRLAQTPVVVFGHTHRPVLQRMGQTWWANPGSWEHVGRHRGHRHGRCDCPSRYLVVTGQGGSLRPRLLGWCARTRAPRTAGRTPG